MLGDGFLSSTINGVVRRTVNNWFSQSTPSQLITAIRNDESLWNTYSDIIANYIQMCPPSIMSLVKTKAPEVISMLEQEYGTLGNAVLEWLKAEQPMYHSLIINTPGGRAWLERQVVEMLGGLGLHGAK